MTDFYVVILLLLTDSEEQRTNEDSSERREVLQQQWQHAGPESELFGQRGDDVGPQPDQGGHVRPPVHRVCNKIITKRLDGNTAPN